MSRTDFSRITGYSYQSLPSEPKIHSILYPFLARHFVHARLHQLPVCRPCGSCASARRVLWRYARFGIVHFEGVSERLEAVQTNGHLINSGSMSETATLRQHPSDRLGTLALPNSAEITAAFSVMRQRGHHQIAPSDSTSRMSYACATRHFPATSAAVHNDVAMRTPLRLASSVCAALHEFH
jgi:hypothetical protein